MAGPWEKYAKPASDGPWAKYAKPEQSAPEPQRDVVATTDDGGIVYRGTDGALGFTSPAYATTDPAQVAKIMEGASPAEVSTSSFDQQTIAQAPVTSRAIKAVEGVPFIGSRIDEAAGALFGEKAAQGVRSASSAMQRERPKESMALGLAGAVAGSLPIALAAGPSIISNAAQTLGGRALQTGIGGAIVGALEGGIYGSGRSEGEGRGANATEGALFGGLTGAALGAAAPYASEGVKRALSYLKGSDVAVISKQLAISPQAARVVKTALDAGDMNEAIDALKRAGPKGMLADAGLPAQQLLDAAAATGGKAGSVARRAVEERVTGASGDLARALDSTLGKPAGIKSIAKGIRQGTAAARDAVYEAAYASPINYSGNRGRLIEGLLSRVPKSAIDDANALMRVGGFDSQQIIAKIADNGKVTYEILPDVRQIDYITRALSGVADKADGAGKLGGQTPLGNAYNSLTRDIRNALKGEVPEYAKALDVASDAISRVKASDIGYSLLRDGTTRETVATALSGAGKAQRDAAKQGIRSYIDDTLANVKTALTDPNMDAREGLKLLRQMSSRANITKVEMVVGKKAAKALFDQLDTATVAFELRAALAANSKTAIRQSIQGGVTQQSKPGMLELLGQGEVVNATKRFVQIFTGSTDEAQALREAGIFEEIATALTQTRGNKAKTALKFVNDAMNGAKLTEQQASFVGNVVASTAFLSGNREASTRLSTR